MWLSLSLSDREQNESRTGGRTTESSQNDLQLSVWSIQEEILFYLIEASFPPKWPFLKYKQETCLSVNLLLHKTTRLLCLTSVVFCFQDIHFVWWAPHRWTHRRLRLLLPCPLPDCMGLSNAGPSQMFWKKHHLYGLKVTRLSYSKTATVDHAWWWTTRKYANECVILVQLQVTESDGAWTHEVPRSQIPVVHLQQDYKEVGKGVESFMLRLEAISVVVWWGSGQLVHTLTMTFCSRPLMRMEKDSFHAGLRFLYMTLLL